jgi:imidazolonepropionase-like amidohydrolase
MTGPVTRIEADLLIPGRGEPIKNGCAVFDRGTIAFAGSIEDAPKTERGGPTVNVPVLMPGMWDVHGHFMGLRTPDIAEATRTPVAVMAGRIVRDAERALHAGFTSVREVGGFGVYLARVVDEGTVPGPHIYGAGSSLSVTGGHGDFHSLPLSVVLEHTKIAGLSVLCDGVPECLKAVRQQLRIGAKVIKVLASGGVMSELDHPIHQQFSDEELRAIVEEAARAERAVAAHCHGKPGIVAALRAGVLTIEHGTYLDEEVVELLGERDAVLVPTRFILERLVAFAKGGGVPEYAIPKALAVAERHKKALALAVRSNVRIAVGTDIWMTGDGGMATWGMNGNEVVCLVEAGMQPLRAIEAATANGPLSLGLQAPKSGQLMPGFDADAIALSKDPLKEIGVLATPDRITHVWKSGELAKGPSKP